MVISASLRRASRAGIILVATLLAQPAAAEAASCAERLVVPPPTVGPMRDIRATDLIELRDFGSTYSGSTGTGIFSLSPDKRSFALLLRRASVTENRYCYGVGIVSLATGKLRLVDVGGDPMIWKINFRGQAELPVGPILADRVLWSPDGRTLAYLRRDEGRTRIWRVDAGGGAAAPVPTGDLDVSRFAWASDGGLVYEVRPQFEAGRAEIAKEGQSGYLYDFRLAPMYGSTPSPAADTPYETRYLSIADGANRAATDREKAILDPAPEGVPPRASLFALGPDGSLAWSSIRSPSHYSGPEATAARIDGKVFQCPDEYCGNRATGLWWLNRDELLLLSDWKTDQAGALALYRWRPGHRPRRLLRTTDLLSECQLGLDGLYCAYETARKPRSVVRISLRDGAMTKVFDPNPEFANIRLGEVRRLTMRAADGAPTFADLVLPPDHVDGQRHPMVIVQYQSRGFLRGGVGDEYPVHLMASRGYAVLSFQRPLSFADTTETRDLNVMQRVNVAGFADRRRVFSALENGVDQAIATGAVDPGKIGITGLSEGASSAIWAIMMSPRYRAAAISNCCEDPYPIFYGNGLAFARDMKSWGYPLPADDRNGFWKTFSLAENAGKITAPVLLQASDQEYRFALQGIGALKEAGRPAEMYIFPNEYHNKWQPVHRAAIYERSIAWFDFWLRGITDPDPAKAERNKRWEAMRRTAAETSGAGS